MEYERVTEEYPIAIYEDMGVSWVELDRTSNIESAISVLYGDLSTHNGEARLIRCPAEYVERLQHEAELNADCYGIPVDIVKAK